MAKDSVRVSLDGKVSSADFKTAVDAFVNLLEVLTDESSPDSGIEWFIELEKGSVVLAARAEFEAVDDGVTAAHVVMRFDEIAEDIQAGRMERYSPPVQEYITSLTSILNGRIPKLIFTAEKTTTVDKKIEPAPQIRPLTVSGEKKRVRTSIKGQIVTLDEKHGLYFGLRPAFADRIIRCYPTGPDRAAFRAALGEHWTRKTWVLVEGHYNQFTTVPTMTGITAIVPLADAVVGGWREARGVAPRLATGTTDSAAEAIRKVRDAD